MTSAHTSLPAARAPARLPLAALLQIPSTLAFKLAESVGSLWIIDLHTATACATPAAVVGTLVGTLGVFVGEDVDVVPVVAVVVGDVELPADDPERARRFTRREPWLVPAAARTAAAGWRRGTAQLRRC